MPRSISIRIIRVIIIVYCLCFFICAANNKIDHFNSNNFFECISYRQCICRSAWSASLRQEIVRGCLMNLGRCFAPNCFVLCDVFICILNTCPPPPLPMYRNLYARSHCVRIHCSSLPRLRALRWQLPHQLLAPRSRFTVSLGSQSSSLLSSSY